MSTMTFDSASKNGGSIVGSGTAAGAVECRLRIHSLMDPNDIVWVPAGGWQAATLNGGNWNVSLSPPPGAPNPASYRLYARLTAGGKDLHRDVV